MTPQGRLVDDFLIEGTSRLMLVLNAPSPGATASLAIGEELAQRAFRDLVGR
jgi:L-2-hydroxyglutarate oxidase